MVLDWELGSSLITLLLTWLWSWHVMLCSVWFVNCKRVQLARRVYHIPLYERNSYFSFIWVMIYMKIKHFVELILFCYHIPLLLRFSFVVCNVVIYVQVMCCRWKSFFFFFFLTAVIYILQDNKQFKNCNGVWY